MEFDDGCPTVIDLSPRGFEALKMRRPFTWLRRVPGFRWMHRHCGAFTGWTCAGCARDIDRACEEQRAAYEESMRRWPRKWDGLDSEGQRAALFTGVRWER